jgi:hypothetical protein
MGLTLIGGFLIVIALQFTQGNPLAWVVNMILAKVLEVVDSLLYLSSVGSVLRKFWQPILKFFSSASPSTAGDISDSNQHDSKGREEPTDFPNPQALSTSSADLSIAVAEVHESNVE